MNRLRQTALTFAVVLALAALAQAQTYTTLYNFTGSADGGYPYAAVINANGNLYGTTAEFGADNYGVVFSVEGSGNESTIYSFTGVPDGAIPYAPVIRDSKGNLYGTTEYGGAYEYCSDGCGVIFAIDSTGKETVLHSFHGGSDGCWPMSGLVEYKGAFYGSTYGCGAHGYGTIFKMTKTGEKTVLHSFKGPPDGASPVYGSLIVDKKDATFYGVTNEGGSGSCPGRPGGCGVLYKMSQKGELSVLYSFAGGFSDGCFPYGTPAQDKKGNLYGTTTYCGASSYYGTVWKVTKKGQETTLHSFSGSASDGANPQSGVGLDAQGNIYGVTPGGGPYVGGVLYELSTDGTFTLLHSFGAGSDGAGPIGQVLVDSQGDVDGTTIKGGTYGYGTVWSYVP